MATEKVGYELTLRDLMSKGLTDINSKLGELEGRLTKAEKAGMSAGQNMSKAFKLLAGAISVQQMYSFGKEVIQTTARFQSLGASIKFASDTAIQGESSMIWVSNLSKKYGLPIEQTAAGFKTLQGAMMKTKFSSSETRKMFAQVSTGIVAMGLSADDAQGTFLALGQIMGKGKVQAEELRGQIGERIPGAFAIAARAMGVTTAELDKMMKDGKLLSEDFLPKFAAEMEKTFGKGAEASVNSLSASLTRLSNSWTEMMVSIGNSDEDGFVSKGLKAVSGLFETIGNDFKTVQQRTREIINPRLIQYLDDVSARQKELKDNLAKGGASKGSQETGLQFQREVEISEIDMLYNKNKAELNKMRQKILNDSKISLGKTTEREADETINTFAGNIDPKELAKYNQLRQQDEIYKQSKAGVNQSYDKAIADLYQVKPGQSSDEDLKKESNSISGHTPKTVNINIEALVKENNNIINNANNPTADLANFMGQLKQGLLTVVNDVNIITE